MSARPKRILFICIHNSARSQMAEAWVNHLCAGTFAAESAGIEPGKLNPLAVEAMAEVGIDIAGHGTQSVAAVVEAGTAFDLAVTVCDEGNAARCPIFPGRTRRLHWGFPDPSAATGTHDEKLEQFRQVRDAIKTRIEEWCANECASTEGSFATGSRP